MNPFGDLGNWVQDAGLAVRGDDRDQPDVASCEDRVEHPRGRPYPPASDRSRPGGRALVGEASTTRFTESCSPALIAIVPTPPARPRSIRLFDSVAPEVNTTSVGLRGEQSSDLLAGLLDAGPAALADRVGARGVPDRLAPILRSWPPRPRERSGSSRCRRGTRRVTAGGRADTAGRCDGSATIGRPCSREAGPNGCCRSTVLVETRNAAAASSVVSNSRAPSPPALGTIGTVRDTRGHRRRWRMRPH